MRIPLAFGLLLCLMLSQVLQMHAHRLPAGTAQPAATESTDHAHVHSHLLDTGSLHADHAAPLDDLGNGDLIRSESARQLGVLAVAVWVMFAILFSPGSAFVVPVFRPRPAVRSRPPLCLRPAPQGPPC
ncbi:MAG: hypothetical protein ACLGI7_16575 [Gammaproteobacteria bacterium]